VKRDLPIAIAAILVILGICYELAVAHPQQPPPPSPTPTAKGKQPSVAPNERVVMRVNGEPVTEREFNAFAQQAPEQMQTFYMSPEGHQALADQLVKFKALEQEGHRLGIENEPEAKARIDLARSNIMAAYTLQKLVSKPNDARLRAEYEKEKKNFETMQLSHILIAYQGGTIPPRGGRPVSVADAMKKAEAIAARLHSGGDFAQIARTESDDASSAARGGQLGSVSPSALPPELQRPVASLKAQQISRPVKSSFGIHIFKSGAHQAQPFEQLKPVLAGKMQRDEAEAALNRLQKSAKVELDPKFFPRGRS
jgi:hypothetical protein